MSTNNMNMNKEFSEYEERMNNNNCIIQIYSFSFILLIHLIRSLILKGYISRLEYISCIYQVISYIIVRNFRSSGKILTGVNMLITSWILCYAWPKYSSYSDTTFFVGFYLGIIFTLFLSRAVSALYKTITLSLISIIFWWNLATDFKRAFN